MAQPEPTPFRRELRSFVRREGRMTDAQREALNLHWPRYGLAAPRGAVDLAALFGREAPRVCEIGFGNGEHLLARAEAEPQHDFIGIEVHRPGVGRLLARAAQAGLNNLRVTDEDAVVVLRDWLPAAALSELLIYFPDPWHKKRHHKRRLIQTGFVAMAATRLRVGGRMRLATDWADYAEQMLAVLSAEPRLANEAPEGGYVARPASRPVTRFEARGARLGHGVWDLSFVRVG